MEKSILLINDMPGYGKVALSAMFPVLAHLGFHVFNLPTALVSNTLDYGKFHILDTTDYMRKSIQVWQELKFKFNAIATGFIVSEEQVQLISDFCRSSKNEGLKIFTDPIMGDEGKLYNGVTERTIDYMRSLIAMADYIVPNHTEACYLTGTPYPKDTHTQSEVRALIDALRELCPGTVLITSVSCEGRRGVYGYDKQSGEYFALPYSEIPVRFPGTGDLFSAVFIGYVLQGAPLQQCIQAAMDVVATLIARNQQREDKYVGLPIESNLDLIKLHL
ncbi:MAG: pyridoxamine kinase [Succinivibrio sp.]|nr:pyridoxamine kinase [Succinivibrio sp.]